MSPDACLVGNELKMIGSSAMRKIGAGLGEVIDLVEHEDSNAVIPDDAEGASPDSFGLLAIMAIIVACLEESLVDAPLARSGRKGRKAKVGARDQAPGSRDYAAVCTGQDLDDIAFPAAGWPEEKA